MPLYALAGRLPEFADPGACHLAPDAQVICRVRLGRDASVWFGAVLRGDNEPIEVGDRSNVQDGAVLHADPGFPLTIGADCTIGHRAILHGCVIGDGVLVGMGAVVMNGARIGAGSLVGAGALVTEGASIPPRSLVLGAPVRALTDAEVERLLRSAMRYVENGRRCPRELREIPDPPRQGRPGQAA
jgi:carbonic anhydrase/acetyltransferase-like protein (isoleucine patch superfamily)